MTRTGKCKVWNRERGFGFLTTDDDGRDVFTHCVDLMIDRDYLDVGEVVSFKIEKSDRGPRAVNVEPI